MILELSDVTKSFGGELHQKKGFFRRLLETISGSLNVCQKENLVFEKFNCEIEKGEFLILSGRNGIGKSVLAKCIAGLERFNGGQIRIDGKSIDASNYNRSLALELGVDYVPQFLPRPFGLSGVELLAFGTSKTLLFSKRKTTAIAKETASKIGVDLDVESLAKPLARLSTIDLQKLFLLRAAMRKSKLLLLDEPTALLGKEDSRQVGTMVRCLLRQGVALVVIAHPAQSIEQLGFDQNEVRVVEFSKSGFSEFERVDLQLVRPSKRLKGPMQNRFEVLLPGCSPEKIEINSGESVAIVGPPTRDFTKLAHESGRQLESTNPGKKIQFVPFQAREKWLVGQLSVLDNTLVTHYQNPDLHSRFWGFSKRKIDEALCKPILESWGIRPPNSHQPLGHLSGGNRQRLLIGRTMYRELDCLVACDIDYGLDNEGIQLIGSNLESRLSKGMCALFFSTTYDLPKAIANRVYELDDDFTLREITKKTAEP